MKKISALLLILLPLIAFSQNDFKAIDSILSVYDQGVMPGVSVSIAKNGKVLYSRSAGYADIEAGTKIDSTTLFFMASVSKQFTAACIVLLEQQGKLSFKDKVSKYFPYFPEYANKISILNLLNHTSGIKDYKTLAMLRGENTFEYTSDDVNELLKRQDLDFKAGKEFSYTNSGYWFLVQIVEKVSGESIIDFARKNIFSPLNMVNTQYVYNPYSVDNMAKGLMKKGKGYKKTLLEKNVIAGSGVLSTANDMQKWLYEMESQDIFGADFWKKMMKENLYKLYKDGVYGKGLFMDLYGKNKRIFHGGYVEGFNTLAEYFPEAKITAVVLTNNDEEDINLINRALVNRVLGYKFRNPKVKKTDNIVPELVLAESDLKKYEGVYENEEGYFFTVSQEKDTLYVLQHWDKSRTYLDALTVNRFKGESVYVDNGIFFDFSDIENGLANVMTIEEGDEKYIFWRVTTKTDLSQYLGDYYSVALDVNYNFIEKEGKLWFVVANARPVMLMEGGENEFSCDWGNLIFNRDKRDRITGFSISCDRARNIRFVKVEAKG